MAIDDQMGDIDGGAVPEKSTRDMAEVARRYKAVIARYDTEFHNWSDRCRRIERLYEDQRGDNDKVQQNRMLNLLWSNVQTLQPAVFARMPHPVVSRRFSDSDPIARVACEVVERCIATNLDAVDFEDTVKLIRDDYLLVARGTVWLRYDPTIESAPLAPEAGEAGMGALEPADEEAEEPANEPSEQPPPPQMAELITDEVVQVEYVRWSDFGHSVARVWSEVDCVWRKVYLTREEGVERFGKAFDKVPLDHKFSEDDEQAAAQTGKQDKATVYEIWNKAAQEVCWVAKDYPQALECGPPPLKFRKFFPCPRPIFGTTTSRSLVPVPDYIFYQDQVEEVNQLTQRIGKLTDALKLAGFYASGDTEVANALEHVLKPGVENVLIPIPNWGKFKEGGGSNGNIEWVPVEQVIKVITACFEARKQLVEDIYQITGISDIVRGDSNPNETATAQNIKNQWGSIRIRDRQAELARFIRDICRMVGEIIAENFQPDTLLKMSNMKLPTREEQMLQQIAAQMAQRPPMAAMPGFQAPDNAPTLGGPPGGPGGPPGAPPAPTGMLPPQPQQVQV